MEKNIEDYLHLYLDSEALYSICFVDDREAWTAPCRLFTDRYFSYRNDMSVDGFRLYLRPLSDMTEEEAKEFCRLEGWGENLENIVVTDDAIDFKRVIGDRSEACISRFTRCRPEMFRWLLSHGFDLFELIDAGLAIDKTKSQQ